MRMNAASSASTSESAFGPAPRRHTRSVSVGGVAVGGDAPVVVQSMTNTDTADIDGTVKQVAALARQGSELVRITVDRDEAAAAVPRIRERLDRIGVDVPLIGDFPVQAVQALPYLLTVILLAGFVGRSVPPKASGTPYVKER